MIGNHFAPTKIPRVWGGDGFLWENLDRWVEKGKFLKVW